LKFAAILLRKLKGERYNKFWGFYIFVCNLEGDHFKRVESRINYLQGDILWVILQTIKQG